ncbi:NifB/NifX family molybdenum-iron cluster-binding protein [candidate division KSB1 bacterium]|nr:NifB/NifX family molybdenum-iron cluster-binding protein [candidate division KSB1 bacterium]
MKQIAIPVFEDRISNRLDCCENLLLVSVEAGEIKKRDKIHLLQTDPFANLKTMIDLGVDVLICNGITDFYSQRLRENHIEVIPWISGEVEQVLALYVEKKLLTRRKINHGKT